jgi:hypothetical protein
MCQRMHIPLLPADHGGQNVLKLSCGSLHYSQPGASHQQHSTVHDNVMAQMYLRLLSTLSYSRNAWYARCMPFGHVPRNQPPLIHLSIAHDSAPAEWARTPGSSCLRMSNIKALLNDTSADNRVWSRHLMRWQLARLGLKVDPGLDAP